ncbi:MAG: IS3 family transposase [Nitrospinae bacterium]|nr:IS3 family transposase [Nitrospinota bacterium]
MKHVLARGLCSLRRACQYFELHRSTYQYEPKESTEYRHKLVARIIAFSKKHSRYGYRRIRALLAHEGWPVSGKFVQKVRREGLAAYW